MRAVAHIVWLGLLDPLGQQLEGRWTFTGIGRLIVCGSWRTLSPDVWKLHLNKMCVYMCVYMYKYMCRCVCVYLDIKIFIVYTDKYKCGYRCANVCIDMYVCMVMYKSYICMFIWVYRYA